MRNRARIVFLAAEYGGFAIVFALFARLTANVKLVRIATIIHLEKRNLNPS